MIQCGAIPKLNNIKNVAACPEGSLDRLHSGTWSVYLSTLFGLRDLASHFQEGPEYSRVLKGRLSWPGARAGCPYPCGPSPLPGTSLDSSVWFHHWCICLFCNHLPWCRPWGVGGDKGPDPFPLAGMTLKGLLRLFSDRITAHLLLCLDLCLHLPSQLWSLSTPELTSFPLISSRSLPAGRCTVELRGKRIESALGTPVFKPCLCHRVAVWPWAHYLTSPNLIFHLREKDYCEN